MTVPDPNTLYTRAGAVALLQGNGFTDRNGNQISQTGGVFTDTLGQTALTVTGSGTPSSPTILSYTTPSGTASFTMSYVAYTIKTNFGCSGIGEYGPTTNNLVDKITLPDASYYQFTYESTPGYSGSVTGRLASIKLPTGGTISYSYSGGNNGIVCSDGSTATLTRNTADGTWTYTRTLVSGTQWQTLVNDPQGNQTVVQFQLFTNPSNNQNMVQFYETQRTIYQGSVSSGSLLRTLNVCYNGSTAPCTGTTVTPPISRRTLTMQLPNGLQSKADSFFDGNGLPTELDEYDFGSGAPGPVVRKTTTSYASLGNNIVSMPSNVTVTDGAFHTMAQVTYGYDQSAVTATSGTPQHSSITGSRGNPTTVSNLVQGTTTLSRTYTYFDTGMVNSATDVNGAQTTYMYGACGNSFPTNVSLPLSLTTSYAWDCNGGVMTSMTDPNGKVTSTAYNDPLWRVTSVTDPLNNTTSLGYNDVANNFYRYHDLWFNANNSDEEGAEGFDPLGRVITTGKMVTFSPNSWNVVDRAYDSNGRVAKVYQPCNITTWAYPWTCTTPYSTQTYDALNRPLVTTDGGGGTVTRTYSGRDVLVTLGPTPAGEVVKQTQYEFDGLGRLKSACQLSSASGSGPCNQDMGGTGFLTTYSYDALGNVLQVVKNAQSSPTETRSFTYDALGRVKAETYPESGTTTYTYDTWPTGNVCWYTANNAGDMLTKTDNAGNMTCYLHDQLHRLTDAAGWVNGTGWRGPCQRFRYDTTANGLHAVPTGYPASPNILGRPVEIETDGASTNNCPWPPTAVTDEWFAYSARGETTDVFESTPHSGGYYHSTAAYWANGVLSSLGIPTLTPFTFGVDSAGRPYTATSGISYVTNTTFNAASQPLTVTLGLGDSANYGYDPNTGRMTNYTFTVGSTPKSQVGSLTWNANGTLRTLAITDGFNSGGAQTCNYGTSSVAGYDEFSRLINVNCGTPWSQTFSYDPFDNITKTGSITWQPGYNQSNNHYQNGATYDNNGNLTNDTFHTYTWDANWQKPLTVDTEALTYDAFGQIVEKNVSGTYTQILFSPIGKRAQMNGQSVIQAYVPLPGGQTAFISSCGSGCWAENFWFSDWLGTVRLSSDRNSRTFVFDRAFAPFGETYLNFGSTANADFTGDTQDTVAGANVGLFDTPFRELHPNQGRWISPDPAHGAWNLYAYAANNPLSFVDPLGLATCTDSDGNKYDCPDPENTMTVQGDPPPGDGVPNILVSGVSRPRFRLIAREAADNGSPLWAGTKSFFSDFSFKGARLGNETWSQCVDRSQDALLGSTGTTALNAFVPFGAFATKYTTPTMRPTDMPGVSVSMSDWEADAFFNARAGAGSYAFASKVTGFASKAFGLATAVATGIKGGFYVACAH
jgi:RHS repeat-associated protein